MFICVAVCKRWNLILVKVILLGSLCFAKGAAALDRK